MAQYAGYVSEVRFIPGKDGGPNSTIIQTSDICNFAEDIRKFIHKFHMLAESHKLTCNDFYVTVNTAWLYNQMSNQQIATIIAGVPEAGNRQPLYLRLPAGEP